MRYWYNKKRKINLRKYTRKLKYVSGKHKILVNFFLVSVIVIITGLIFYKIYVDKTSNYISTVLFSKDDINNINIENLLKTTENNFLWKNIIILNAIWFDSITNSIKEKYPFVNTINTALQWDWIISITFDMINPKIIFFSKDKQFLVYSKNKLVSISIDNNIFLSWAQLIYLPDRIVDDINWIFFKVSYDKLLNFLNSIKQKIELIETIIYYPWWEKIQVNTKNKIIYFDIWKDIKKQLYHLQTINQKEETLKNPKKIDLGSQDNEVYITY